MERERLGRRIALEEVDKTAKLLYHAREALAHARGAVALIDEAHDRSERTLYEGYSIGRSRQALLEAIKLLIEAETKLASALEQRKESAP